MLTTTTFADRTERSTPTCGGSEVPAAGCGPSSPLVTVAELQARLSTLTPAIDCSEDAYVSAERWQAMSSRVGFCSGVLPMPAAVESPMTTTSVSARFGPTAAGTGARLVVPTRSDSE